jgi:predicted nucleic acid-binding protein
VALLDANVLYPARLRDLLVRLAIAGLYQARWSEQILDECFANLIANRPDLPVDHLERTRDLLTVALPDAVVTDYQDVIAPLDLPDPDDRHVLAAAVVAGAEFLVTANLADFPARSMPAPAVALSPDDFVLKLIHADPEAVAAVVDDQAAALRKPPMTTVEFLDGLEVVGLARSVYAMRHDALMVGWTTPT